jgi:hypothetical protein
MHWLAKKFNLSSVIKAMKKRKKEKKKMCEHENFDFGPKVNNLSNKFIFVSILPLDQPTTPCVLGFSFSFFFSFFYK